MTIPMSFLSQIDVADRAALEERWTVVRHERDAMILLHDEGGCDVYFVLEGRARATAYSGSGRAIAYRDIGPGEIFGELAAIDGEPRSASVMAIEPTTVARLSEAAFRELIDKHPGVTWVLLRHLSKQMRRMTDRIYEFNTLVVRKRLARELIRLAEQTDVTTGLPSISPAPTHFELASMISTHREAVSREISALKKSGLIEKRGHTILLRDRAALRALAEAE